jgi:hypothetical protein
MGASLKLLAALAVVTCAAPAPAQDPTPPDPATLTLPDMTPTRDPDVISDGWRHFYFHRAGVTYAEAYADFRDCYRFLPTSSATFGLLPATRLWNRRMPGAPAPPPAYNYGVVGAIIGGMVMSTLHRRDMQSRMRRCMEPRGYVRYPLKEDVWERLIDNYSQVSIALQALAASGPAPNLPVVTR